MAVRKNLLHIHAYLATHAHSGIEEWIVIGCSSIVVQAKDNTCQMRIIRLGATELIIGNRGSRAIRRRTAWQILQVSASSVISHKNIQLAIRTKFYNTTVVIAARRLPR